MRIAVLGTGAVGRAIAGRLDELGHVVTVGTRDPEATLARGDEYRAFAAEHPGIQTATYSVAVADADLVVNATSGAASLDAMTAAGAENIGERIVLDIANPLDFSAGFPPTLFIKDTGSLGEEIQSAFPRARVVKSLNTITAELMVHPELVNGGDHTVFVSGNDDMAKEVVTDLLREIGHRDVVDLGDITTSRGTEMYLALWVRAMQAVGTPMFSVKVVR